MKPVHVLRRCADPSSERKLSSEADSLESPGFAVRHRSSDDAGLEHSVRVGRLLGNRLQHVPMLDHLPVIVQTEDVDPCPSGSAWPQLPAVQHYIVLLCDYPEPVKSNETVVGCN
jgi:hypothetical protein